MFKERLAPLLAAAVVLLCLAPVVPAVPPPGEDLLGIYTEEDGSGFANLDANSGAIIRIHLILTNCSSPCGLSGWECSVEVPAQAMVLQWQLNGPAINIAGGAPGFIGGPDFAVGLFSPIPCAEAIWLCTLEVLVLSDDPAYFKLHPVPAAPSISGAMAYARTSCIGELRALGWSSGSEDYAVFGINTGPLPHYQGGHIPVVTKSWGSVKKMYE